MMNFRTRVLIVEPLPHVIEISLDCNPGAVSIHAVIALRAAPLAMKPETRNLVLGCRVAWATIHGDAAAVTTTIAIGIFMTAAAATTTIIAAGMHVAAVAATATISTGIETASIISGIIMSRVDGQSIRLEQTSNNSEVRLSMAP